ncbi:MAG: response regulator transcription factor [Nocardioides sp.]|nr:response regulator transcription factor [Nocardioides sp.]
MLAPLPALAPSPPSTQAAPSSPTLHSVPPAARRAYPVRVSVSVPEVVRAGLVALLEPHQDRIELLDDVARGRAHVDVFDPDSEAAAVDPGCPRVALTWDTAAPARARAQALGAVRVLPLSIGVSDLLLTVEQVHRSLPGTPVPGESHHDEVGGLSPRERDVVSGICRGLSNAEIADDLYLSVNSVKTYIRTAYRKMGVSSRSQAVLWGLAHGV